MYSIISEFGIPISQVVITGSASLSMLGLIDRKVSDLDIIVTESVWDSKVRFLGPVEYSSFPWRREHIKYAIKIGEDLLDVDFYRDTKTLQLPEYFRNSFAAAHDVNGLKVCDPKELLAYKKLKGRVKDMSDISFAHKRLAMQL